MGRTTMSKLTKKDLVETCPHDTLSSEKAVLLSRLVSARKSLKLRDRSRVIRALLKNNLDMGLEPCYVFIKKNFDEFLCPEKDGVDK